MAYQKIKLPPNFRSDMIASSSFSFPLASTSKHSQQSVLTPPRQTVTVPKKIRILVPKSSRKLSILNFATGVNIDLGNQDKVFISREKNTVLSRSLSDVPKHGAGSEYGKEAREIARQKKFGREVKASKTDDLPWHLTCECDGKKKSYRGLREGGIADNSTYYIFKKTADGDFEAYPLFEWYTFSPTNAFKVLGFDEAEKEYENRKKRLSRWYLKAKVKKAEETPEDEKEQSSKKRTFALTEADEWDQSEDEVNSDMEGDRKQRGTNSDLSDGDVHKNRGKNSKARVVLMKKKPNKDPEAEFTEESDDGDHEGIELDYSSDISSSSSEHSVIYEEKGLDQELAVSRLHEDSESEAEGEAEYGEDGQTLTEEGKELMRLLSEYKNIPTVETESSLSDLSDDSDEDLDKSLNPAHALILENRSIVNFLNPATSSVQTTMNRKNKDDIQSGSKRKRHQKLEEGCTTVKKAKSSESTSTNMSQGSTSTELRAAVEEKIRTLLVRKPRTFKEIIAKINHNKFDAPISSVMISEILRSIKPSTKDVNSTTYLYIAN